MQRDPLCPLCNNPLDPDLFAIQPKLEDHIARILREDNPGWEPEDGTCPECVHSAVEKAIEARSLTSRADCNTPFLCIHGTAALTHAPACTPTELYGRDITVPSSFRFLSLGPRPAKPHPCYVDATGRVPAEKQNFKKLHVSSWHGLMTSAIGAGNGSLSNGLYRGLARDAQLVLVKTGNSRRRGIRDRDISRALMWVLNNHERFNIRIVNISLGGDSPTTGKFTELDELVEEAVSRGLW
jgi:subtilisin family serine protease